MCVRPSSRLLEESFTNKFIDKLLIKIYVKHNCFCSYLLYTRLHVSTYLSGHHQAFLQLNQRMLCTCWNTIMFTLLKIHARVSSFIQLSYGFTRTPFSTLYLCQRSGNARLSLFHRTRLLSNSGGSSLFTATIRNYSMCVCGQHSS